ncbi:MAG: metalloregulator ArsR/SmtB family transcription factor [Pseudomonadota bacterium]
METIARILKLLGHPDRLRILALLSQEELTVSELVSVLELSQPRVTQYIRSLEDADILERIKEGSWVFSRLKSASESDIADMVAGLIARLPEDDAILSRDQKRLQQVRRERSIRAEQFFADVANNRGRLSHEFLPQSQVEAAILAQLAGRSFEFMVDLGTGSGRMLALLADRVKRGIGVDLSSDMLKVARYTLSDERFGHLSVQQSDLKQTPLADNVADLVTLHQVLHHMDRPSAALKEASRLLKPGGVLLIVDFAEHEREEFRSEFAHRRLGFAEQEVADLMARHDFKASSATSVQGGEESHPDLLVWQATLKPEKSLETVL